MKVTKIRLVACWDGYCGTCGDVRPLVLTQSGRFSLRAWWGGAGDEDRPLTMTCRVCGIGVHVPHHEEDDDVDADLELLDGEDDEPADDEAVGDGVPAPVTVEAAAVERRPVEPAAVELTPVDAAPVQTAAAGPELTAVRTALASAMAAVVERSSAATGPAELTTPRTGAHDDTDEALRLLAVGFDARELTGEPAHH